MRAVREVVPDVLAEKAMEVPIVEHDDVVEQLTADGADKALSHPVLPGAAVAGAGRFDVQGPHRPGDLRGEDRVAVEDQVPRRAVIRKRLPQLLDDPLSRR